MKAHYFKSTLLLALLLIAGASLEAQTLKKDFHKEFTPSGTSELVVINQFGDITITEWDQNKVVIDVLVEVNFSDESKSKKLLDKITVEFKENGSKVMAETKIGENGKLNINTDKGEKNSFSINYTVKCPKNLNIKIENQFGDLVVGTLTGPFEADLQFGSFNAVSLTGPQAKIEMQFGKVSIGTLKDAKFDVQHCDLVKIPECENLVIDGQFTNLEIGSISSLKADLSSCKVNIDVLTEMLDLEANMGNIKIANVAASFQSVNLEQNMGEVSLNIDPKAGYKLKANVNMGSIKVPEGFKTTKDKDSHMPGLSPEKVTGTVGNGNSSITIECNMGTVRVR